MLIAATGSYTSSFLTAAALLIVGAFLTLTLKGRKTEEPVIQKEAVLSYGGSE
jgi:hypothetical protein